MLTASSLYVVKICSTAAFSPSRPHVVIVLCSAATAAVPGGLVAE